MSCILKIGRLRFEAFGRCVVGLAMLAIFVGGASGDFAFNETGVISEASIPKFASGGVTAPQVAAFDGNSLFGTPPPGVEGFTGSAVISSDSPLPAVVNEVAAALKVETSVVPNGFDVFIGNRSQAQVTFQVQTVGGSATQVPAAFNLNSSTTLTSPTGDPNDTAFAGHGFTFDFKRITPTEDEIESLNSFAQIGTTGSVVFSEGTNIVAVVNEAGSTGSENRKHIAYSQIINANLDVGETYTLNASSSCFSFVYSGFTATGGEAYSCLAGDTFDINLASSDPNVRFNVINMVAVPEPSAWIYLLLISGAIGVQHVVVRRGRALPKSDAESDADCGWQWRLRSASASKTPA